MSQYFLNHFALRRFDERNYFHVAATTSTSIGDVRVIGVCIPWRDAHVRTGRKDRRAWQDHLAYLDGLDRVLAQADDAKLIVAGDFNQRVPRKRQPFKVFEALEAAIPPGWPVVTEGLCDASGAATIDHVVVTLASGYGRCSIMSCSCRITSPSNRRLSRLPPM